MAMRTALPAEAVTITPGYSWRLDLDILFDGERPTDWPDWIVRMHIWSDTLRMTLSPGNGVQFIAVEGLPKLSAAHVIPVIELTAAQTAHCGQAGRLSYLIDLTAPEGETEDYFFGYITKLPAPPAELLA